MPLLSGTGRRDAPLALHSRPALVTVLTRFLLILSIFYLKCCSFCVMRPKGGFRTGGEGPQKAWRRPCEDSLPLTSFLVFADLNIASSRHQYPRLTLVPAIAFLALVLDVITLQNLSFS